VRRALPVAVIVALAFAPSALACNAHPTLSQLEGQVMCPVCGTTLDQSDSPAAQQIKRAISARIKAGQSDCEIKDALVANYGQAILAAPEKSGFGLLAWWLPIGGIVLAGVAIGVAAWRWSRRGEPEATFDPSQNGHAALDPALERRLDEELARFDG
jgi:cytochrome c-type biogenesis protein CcmH/NrfF